MKKNYILLLLSFLTLVGFAQNNTNSNIPINLKSGTQFYTNNLVEFVNSNKKETIIQNRYYKFVQFNAIPSQEMKEKMETTGLRFLEYIPMNTYLVSFPKNFDKTNLLSYGIKSVMKITIEDRITDLASSLPFPEWAMEETNVILFISFYDDLDFYTCLEKLGDEIISIKSINKYAKNILVTVNPEDVDYLLNQSFIRTLDLTPEPGKPEHELSRNMHRSTMVNTRYSAGRKYDGTGVVVVDNDDGIVGPHIDFTGRMTQPGVAFGTTGTHGDMTAGIIAGAGNLDPNMGGMAPGCDLIVQDYSSALPNTVTLHTVDSAVIFSSSYSNGCNAGYTSLARQVDQEIRQNPTMIQIFSAGNSNNNNCGYGAGTQWGNITGGHKQGKNVIATANLENNMTLATSSSRGPADDGRIKPDIAAHGNGNYSTAPNNTYSRGSGTSAACPSISGVMAQMYNAHQVLKGSRPESGLMKCIILNSAEDFGNVGPDFKFGWGRVNALRSVETIETNRYLSSTISNAGLNSHQISVPANVKEVKVMVYWHDYEGSTSASKALVNNLDIKMELGVSTFLPWILDPTPNTTALNTPATKGVDTLNNVEQVSILNPASGTYTLKVAGTSIPQGPQKYFVAYDFIYDELQLINPNGGEGFVPGVTERIFWDAYGNTGSFTLTYSVDSGSTWSSIGTAAATARYLDWTVPNSASGKALVKIVRGSLSDVSNHTFTILATPQNLQVVKVCPLTMEVSWTAVTGADEYQVYLLGNKYMDSVGRTAGTTFQIPITNPMVEKWFSVSAIKTNTQGNIGRRQIAEYHGGGLLNCILPTDASVSAVVSPNNSDCIDGATDIIVKVENLGSSSISNVPVKYKINNGSVTSGIATGTIAASGSVNYTFTTPYSFTTPGIYNITAWTELSGDLFNLNDTVHFVYNHSNILTIPFIENFNSFSDCGTDNNCEATICNLIHGFSNLTNGVGDDIDWRTNSLSTPSENTGPSGDHTTGFGKYLYIEASRGCSFKKASLTTPCIKIDKSVSYPALSFWYHMYGTVIDSLSVDIFDGTIWHLDQFKIGGNQGNQWYKAVIYLNAFSDKTIKIRVNGTTGGGYLSDIAIDDFGIDSHVGLTENELDNLITIFPNPTNGEFNVVINNPDLEEVNVHIIDMYGKSVYENVISSKNNKINLKNYASGVYTLVIKSNNNLSTKKIIIK